jgi:hypothetical protein
MVTAIIWVGGLILGIHLMGTRPPSYPARPPYHLWIDRV